jgi:8-oxo-dGTP diphosphatase
LPGGGVEENESILGAVYREISEESGIIREDLVFMRKVGELKYYKPIIHKKVHMHNFLFLYQGECLEDFQFVVKSNDKDNGFIWNYGWVSSNKLVEIDPELNQVEK